MDELNSYIGSYIAKKSCSLSSLSRETGVNYTTIKRIYSNEVTEPEFTNVLQLITFLCTNQEAMSFLRKYYPKQSHCFTELNKDYKISDHIINEQLVDPFGFLLIHMGFAKSGMTRSTVTNKIGSSGLEKLEELLNLGILEEINGRIKTVTDFKCANIDVMLEKHKLALRYFKKSFLGDKKSLIAFQVDGFSEWGLEQIYEIEKKKIASVAEIMKDPKGKGDNVAFVGTLFNRIEEAY